MKKEDLLKVYACAGALWSSFKIPQRELEAQLCDEVWFDTLGAYDIKIVLFSLREYAKTNDFCNIAKVGLLCDKFTQMQNGTWIDEEEVLKEIRKAISYGKYRENFEKLSPFAKEIVGHPAYLAKWAQSSEVDTVIMSNLRKTVRNVLEKRQTENSLKAVAGKEQKKLNG